MDRQWTRAHDAVIAEKCEGWTVTKEEDGDYWFRRAPSVMEPVNHYTDITATIRAAEAWRKQKLGRYWEHGVNEDGNEFARVGTGFGEWQTYVGPAALAWALWEAVEP